MAYVRSETLFKTSRVFCMFGFLELELLKHLAQRVPQHATTKNISFNDCHNIQKFKSVLVAFYWVKHLAERLHQHAKVQKCTLCFLLGEKSRRTTATTCKSIKVYSLFFIGWVYHFKIHVTRKLVFTTSKYMTCDTQRRSGVFCMKFHSSTHKQKPWCRSGWYKTPFLSSPRLPLSTSSK